MPKVMIVEENTTYRQAIKDSIVSALPSIEIEEAATGREALKKVESFRPDFIFTDISLPDVMGLDLTRQIKLKYPSTKIAVLTNYDLRDCHLLAAGYGAICFLYKDLIRVDDILKVIKEHTSR